MKKVLIADNIAPIVNHGFADIPGLNGISAVLIAYLFAVQIYCDFSGYSDIAKGTASLFGIHLMDNFDCPYFSKSPAEFWRRWHISLSTWLRDYVYIPLGGNRKGATATYWNLVCTMLLGGLWHGAAWNFVLWGGYHGALLIAFRAISKRITVRIPRVIGVLLFFQLTCVGWVLFRARSLADIASFFGALTRPGLAIAVPDIHKAAIVLPFVIMEIAHFLFKDRYVLMRLSVPLRVCAYVAMYVLVVTIGSWRKSSFIYFQF